MTDQTIISPVPSGFASVAPAPAPLPGIAGPGPDVMTAGRPVWLPDVGRTDAILSVEDNGFIVTTTGVTSERVIPLPAVGESVSLPGGVFTFLGMGRCNADVLVGLVTLGGSVHQAHITPPGWDARRVVLPESKARAPLTTEQLCGLVVEQWGRRESDAKVAAENATATATAAAQAHLDRLIESAWEWADDYDICEKFEAFCEQNGLRGRESEWNGLVTLTIDVVIPFDVKGPATEDNARDTFNCQYDADDVARMLRAGEIELDDLTIREIDRLDVEQR